MTDCSPNHVPVLMSQGEGILPVASTIASKQVYPPAYYHYTSRRSLEGILRCRMIVPDIDPWDLVTPGKPPLVWVSAMSPWDPICRATLELDPTGWSRLPTSTVPGVPYGAARIHVAGTVTKEWDALLSSNGASSAAIFKLAQTGYDSGSDPERWRACPGPVRNCFWLDVQVWSGTEWESLDTRGDFYRIGDLDAFISHHPVIKEA